MSFGNLAGKNESDPRTLGLRREERDEQIRAARQARPLVLYEDCYRAVLACPSDTDTTACLQRCIDGVSQQVYKKLIELITIGANDGRWSSLDTHRQPCLERGHATNPRAHIERNTLWRRQTCQP